MLVPLLNIFFNFSSIHSYTWTDLQYTLNLVFPMNFICSNFHLKNLQFQQFGKSYERGSKLDDFSKENWIIP